MMNKGRIKFRKKTIENKMEPVVDATARARPWLQFQTHPTENALGIFNVRSLPRWSWNDVITWVNGNMTWYRTAMLFTVYSLCLICAFVIGEATNYGPFHQNSRTCATLHDCMEPIRQGKNELGLQCIEAHIVIKTPNWILPKAHHGCEGFATYCDVSDLNIGRCGRCEVKAWIRCLESLSFHLFVAMIVAMMITSLCSFVVVLKHVFF